MKTKLILAIVMTTAIAASGCGMFKSKKEYAELPEIATETKIATLWQTKAGNGSGIKLLRLSPTQVLDKVYVPDNKGRITALNTESGKEIWQLRTKLSITTGLAAFNDSLIFATENGDVVAVSQQDASVIWKKSSGNEVLATPAIIRDKALVHTIDGRVIAFNAATGDIIWENVVKNPGLTLRGSSEVVATAKLAIVGYNDGSIVAYDLLDGSVEWQQQIAVPSGRTQIERMVDITVKPIIADNTVFVAGFRGKVLALDLETGEIKWQQKVTNISGMAFVPGTLVVVDGESIIWGLDAITGAALWKQQELSDRDLSTPAVVDGHIVVADGAGFVHWLAADTGMLKANRKLGSSKITVKPLTVDNKVIITDVKGNVAAFIAG